MSRVKKSNYKTCYNSNEELTSEQKSNKSLETAIIERSPHDKKNPYTMILNSLIRNQSLTPCCRWLLIYLLSNDATFSIKVSALIKHLKPHYSKHKVYSLINEAIEAGYMKREVVRNNGKVAFVRYFVSENPTFKNKLPLPTFQEVENQDPEKWDNKEITSVKEKTSKKNIIAQPEVDDPPPKRQTKMPAGSNNNSFGFLEKCSDLSDRQKKQLMKHPPANVEKAVRYAYHPTTAIKGGPIGRLKLLQHILNNMDLYEDTFRNLDKPPEKKTSKKDVLLGKFKRGKIYNGYEFLQDEIGVGFIKPGMNQPHSVRWNDFNFTVNFLELLEKLKIDY